MKYTKEYLAPIVAQSQSMAEVCRRCGVYPGGAAWQHIRGVVRKLELDTSHFLGKAAYSGARRADASAKKPWQQVLVPKTHGRRESSARLRAALLESGIPHRCKACGIGPEWQSQQLVLEVDHINGDRFDCTPENLQFLCPNCHSQTRTYRNYQKHRRTWLCQDCGIGVSKGSTRCHRCAALLNSQLKGQEKIVWPSTAELVARVQASTYVAVGRQLGVTDQAVKKRIRCHPNSPGSVRRTE